MKFVIAALIIVIGIAAGTGMTVACEMPDTAGTHITAQ